MSRLIRRIPVLALLAVWGCAAFREGRPPAAILAVGDGPRPEDLVVTFFEVGLGDATLIEFPGGGTLLADAGIGWRVLLPGTGGSPST